MRDATVNASRPSIGKVLAWAGYAGTLLLPLLPLRHLSAIFPQDWTNHQWMVAYYGDYFRQHGTLPATFNTAAAVGMATPVFYGWLFYPLLGVVAAWTGAALALRLAVAALVAIQFFALFAVGRRVFQQTGWAYVVASSVVWGIYALTNLYHRGALAEYFGTGFFVTALAFGVLAVGDTSDSARWFHGWLAGVSLLLVAGTHPPTAVLATVFIGLLAVVGLAVRGRALGALSPSVWLRLAGAALVGGLILAPWIYANVRFAGQLAVAGTVKDFIFRPENCDSVFGRFAPFPFDGATLVYGPDGSNTAYLEAPVNAVLLMLLFWNAMLLRRSRQESQSSPGPFSGLAAVFGVSVVWFVLLCVLSLSPAFASCFHVFAPYVQYAYRLVSHCNAALLVAVLASGALVARRSGYRRYQRETNWVVAVALAVSLFGLGIKLQHAEAMVRPAGDRPASMARRLAETAHDYDVPGWVRRLTPDEAAGAVAGTFPVGRSGAEFGQPGALSFELARPAWVRTNAVVFPWLELQSKGNAISAEQVAQTDGFLAVRLPAGRHELRVAWRPDPVWQVLHRLSWLLFTAVFAVSAVWAGARGVQLFTLPNARAAEPTP